MCNDSTPSPNLSRHYRIVVEGTINPGWSDWLGGMQISARKETGGMPVTELTGLIADQAALRGILIRLWDLNLSLRTVQQVDPDFNQIRRNNQ
jgi:hypothetical protein